MEARVPAGADSPGLEQFCVCADIQGSCPDLQTVAAFLHMDESGCLPEFCSPLLGTASASWGSGAALSST